MIAFESFTRKINKILGGRDLATMSEDDLLALHSVVAYAYDLILNQMERQGLIGVVDGKLLMTNALPEGIKQLETAVTRGELPLALLP